MIDLGTITMTLDRSSIEDAIKKVKAANKRVERICEDLVKELVEYGIDVAQLEVERLGAVYTGELEQSIQGVFFKEEHLGVIYTDVPYALYVEYGTGIVGANSPHPEAGKAQWKYDVHHHGERGWWYPAPYGWVNIKDGADANVAYAWTKGQPSAPFMYNTMRILEEYAKGKAGRI